MAHAMLGPTAPVPSVAECSPSTRSIEIIPSRCAAATRLAKEAQTPVCRWIERAAATFNGKPVKMSQEQLFAASLVKDGITKGPQSKALLAGFIERLEAQLAAEVEARKKAEAQKPAEAFNWGEEQERLIQELARVTGRDLESFGSDEER